MPYVRDPSVINVLLIGRCGVGKSTLIETLRDLSYISTRTGCSLKREPSCNQLIIGHHDGKTYTLNIIDTPGFYENRHNPNEIRIIEQLVSFLRDMFVSGGVCTLNAICFVTIAGRMNRNDIETFNFLINFLGPRFGSISSLVLTHCDKMSMEALNQLSQDITTHPECASVVDYCKLGIYYHGIIDMNALNVYDEEMRDLVQKSIMKLIEPMCAKLMDFFVSRSDSYVTISLNDFEIWLKHLRHSATNN